MQKFFEVSFSCVSKNNAEALPGGSAKRGRGAVAHSNGGCPNGCESEKTGCRIKGDINSEDVKIYYLAGDG
jgi:hypothetical protein